MCLLMLLMNGEEAVAEGEWRLVGRSLLLPVRRQTRRRRQQRREAIVVIAVATQCTSWPGATVEVMVVVVYRKFTSVVVALLI